MLFIGSMDLVARRSVGVALAEGIGHCGDPDQYNPAGQNHPIDHNLFAGHCSEVKKNSPTADIQYLLARNNLFWVMTSMVEGGIYKDMGNFSRYNR